jgi:hypothetical protein
MSMVKAENTVRLVSAREDAKGLVGKITLLEGELVAECQAQEASERECQEQFEELTLLDTQGSKLCHAVVGPQHAMHQLSEGMQIAALCQTEMSGELAML